MIHGGAGAACPAAELVPRHEGMLKAARRALVILRRGGAALDAVVAAVSTLEDDPLFNAGCGSSLNANGSVEMDAAVMVAGPAIAVGAKRLGGVAIVSRIRNPVILARAVMEKSPHVLIGAAGAERFARLNGIALCGSQDLITPRARERWSAMIKRLEMQATDHGTVGAVAIDINGELAAATSTGGITGKLPGRIGDSPLPGAGIFAAAGGAASATGFGEAIIESALCREAVHLLTSTTPKRSAIESIAAFGRTTGSEAGVILVDSYGRIGCAHNAAAMEVVSFDPKAGLRHQWVKPIARSPDRGRTAAR
jgi:beta-aspartyl-peptidase (threonine type)